MREVVLARIVIEEDVVLVDRGVVEARVAAVERLDHVPGTSAEVLDGAIARELQETRTVDG